MLNFLFRGRKTPEVKVETQREMFTRLVDELNAAIDKLADKPKVTLDPATGHIHPEMPEQFPDEALALPKPATGAAKPKAAEDPATTKPEAAKKGDVPAAEPPEPKPT